MINGKLSPPYELPREYRDRHIAEIADQLMRGRVGFLLGAGMSVPSGGIKGSELALRLVWKSLYKSHHETLPPELEQQIREVCSRFPVEAIAEGTAPSLGFAQSDLDDLLKETVFDGKEPKKHSGHTALAALVKKLRIRMVFTTNWDYLLEEAFADSAKPVTQSSFRTLDGIIDSGKTAIVHLHGTFNDNPLIKESDLMDPDRPLFSIFMSELLSKIFVFVGYSLSDPNIRSLYHKSGDILSKRREKLEKKTYVVAPANSEADFEISRAVWNARHATYIPMSAEDFFEALYKEAATHALNTLKKRLRERLNVSQDDLQVKVDEIVNVFPAFESSEHVLFYLDAITRGGRR